MNTIRKSIPSQVSAHHQQAPNTPFPIAGLLHHHHHIAPLIQLITNHNQESIEVDILKNC